MESKVWWMVEQLTASSLAAWAVFSCWALLTHSLTTLTRRYTFLFAGIYCTSIFFSLLSVKITMLSGLMESDQPVVNVIWTGKKIMLLKRNYRESFLMILELIYLIAVTQIHRICKKCILTIPRNMIKNTNIKNAKMVAWLFNTFSSFSL